MEKTVVVVIAEKLLVQKMVVSKFKIEKPVQNDSVISERCNKYLIVLQAIVLVGTNSTLPPFISRPLKDSS